MARFNINEYNKDKYEKVSLQDGLNYLETNKCDRLYSDGLEFGEYITHSGNHFEYEDGCYLGVDDEEMIQRTGGIGSWMHEHNFYIEIN